MTKWEDVKTLNMLDGNKKILVCGSGPSLPTQLKGVDLSDFFVVRINPWREIDGYDNKCDAWAFYPYHKIDFESYLSKTKYLWMPHFGMARDCKTITGRWPDYVVSKDDTINLHVAINNAHPTSGVVAIYMAMLLDADVYIAGFDFSKGGRKYYWDDSAPSIEGLQHHKQWLEEKWVNEQIKTGKLFKLGAN